jgi:GT2 family glycosyltransferase
MKIIIPVLGEDRMTQECIASIRKYSDVPIVVVDNLGTFVPTKGTDVVVMKGQRWGFAKSINEAARYVFDDMLILNNDTLALTDFPSAMGKLLGGDVGVVGALLLYPDGRIQHCGSAYNKGNPCHPGKGSSLHNNPEALLTKKVEAVTFACALVSVDCWDALGGLHENVFPFAYEDIDFCMRARKEGYSIYYCAEARLIHKEHYTQRKHLKDVSPLSTKSLNNLRKRWG